MLKMSSSFFKKFNQMPIFSSPVRLKDFNRDIELTLYHFEFFFLTMVVVSDFTFIG